MRKLLCPQCKVSSMYVKNGKGERRAVYVTDGGVVVARKEGETLDGFDLETVYCMGCSWSGSPKRMVKMWFVQYKPADERLFSTLPSLRATSPIFCVTKHRGGVLNVSDCETEILYKATGTWRERRFKVSLQWRYAHLSRSKRRLSHHCIRIVLVIK